MRKDSSHFSLGHRVKDRSPVDFPVRALKRHLVCIGSTGSGKTVFCKLLCEKALQIGIPVIALDPQGDLASMSSIITENDASQKGLSLETRQYLKSHVEPIVFTPESRSGIPICANPFSTTLLADPSENPIKFEKTVDLLAEVLVSHLKGLPRNRLSFFSGRPDQVDQICPKRKTTAKSGRCGGNPF